MQRGWFVGLCLGLVACEGEAPATTTADTLVLELGGPHRKLGEALRALGAATPPVSVVPPAPRDQAPVAVSSPPIAPPEVTPNKVPSPRVVVLVEGMTVTRLAGDELGDSNRWREILALNGWTEAQARRLPVGTEVKLPAK